MLELEVQHQVRREEMLGVVCAWPMAPSSPTAPQTHPPNKSVRVHVCEWVEKAEEETSDGFCYRV